MLDLILMTITVLLVLASVTGYDKYVAAKIRSSVRRERGLEGLQGGVGHYEADSFTKMKIKKVKASRIGSYLVITLLISEGEDSGKGEAVEIDNPILLTYLEDEGVITS
ncbi:MAG: hypothetical protein QXS42_00170 [Zestosphaera sp.]